MTVGRPHPSGGVPLEFSEHGADEGLSGGTAARDVEGGHVMGDIRGFVRARGLVLLALCCFAVPLAGPGVATATPASVIPVVDCITVDRSGDFTAVLGYSNPSSVSVTIPHSSKNKLTPTRYDGNQPTTFLPGRQRGVFSVRITTPHAKWMLQGSTVVIDTKASRCPPATEMPGTGNGTGPAIGLLAAGVVGFVLLQRVRKRLTDAAPATPSAHSSVHSSVQENDHA